MGQPGKVANPARRQLNREKIFPCPRACLRIWSRETGSAVPSRVSLLVSIFRLNLAGQTWSEDSSNAPLIREGSIPLTAVCTQDVLWEWTMMPQELAASPAYKFPVHDVASL